MIALFDINQTHAIILLTMSTLPPPSKKRKLEQPNKTPKFTSADQLRQALQNQNQSNPNAIVDGAEMASISKRMFTLLQN